MIAPTGALVLLNVVPETVQLLLRRNGQVLTARPGDVLGRGDGANVRIERDVVSRQHAQLHRGPEGWFLTDLDSANGLFGSDGIARERIELSVGETVFSLGPPEAGCELAITIPERLAHSVTNRIPLQDLEKQWPRSGPHDPPTPAPTVPPPAAPVLPPPPVQPPPAPRTRHGVSVRAEAVTVVVQEDLTILQPTWLTLPAGSMTAIVGPSGCGKSTLANLISGRSEPTAGVVAVDGVLMDAAVRTRIGVVPQYDAVHERLTVRQALSAAAKLRLPPGTTSDTIDATVTSTAARLGLSERLDTLVASLSGGQKKRVSVGYELVATPVMLVLDEPTSGLDPGLEQDLIEELRSLADSGTTTVLVTHSPEAATVADLVIVMAPGGHLTFVGPPTAVLGHFGVDDWADVFGRLTAETGPQWAAYYATTELYNHHVVAGPAAPLGGPSVGGLAPRSWWSDLRVMTTRYVQSLRADRRNLAILAAQAPLLGALFALVLSTRVFRSSLVPQTDTRQFLLACVLAMAWIGSSNSVREIVKQRRTFLRERAVGVSPSALVASRWLVLGVITVLQAAALYLTATIRQSPRLGSGVALSFGPLEFIGALALVGLATVGVGLVVSGTVRDANKAMATLPLVLIPLILFCGLVVPTAGRPVIEQLSYLNPILGGTSAGAVVVDVLDAEGCNATGIEAQLQIAFLGESIECDNSRWKPTASSQGANFALGAVQVLVLLALSFEITRRTTRDFSL